MPTILIVDAESYQRFLVREILSEDLSLTFVEADTEAQVVSLAHRYAPQIIILNIRPVLFALHIFEQLQADADLMSIPVIFTTTAPRTDRIFTAVLATGYAVLRKPFEPGDLQVAVRQALPSTQRQAYVH